MCLTYVQNCKAGIGCHNSLVVTKLSLLLNKNTNRIINTEPHPIKVTLNSDTITMPFLLADSLREEDILGRPWLKNEDAILDFKCRCVYYGQKPPKNDLFRRYTSRI